MKITGIRYFFINLFLILMASVFPQAESYARLINFNGKIEVYRELSLLKPRKGMELEAADILSTRDGEAVLFYTTGSYYGYFRGNSARCNDALEYRLLHDTLASKLEQAKSDLGAIFLQGTPVPGFQAESRQKNINLVLILDVSTSMRKFFESVQTFIVETIIEKTLIHGDYLYFYTFGIQIRERMDKVLVIPQNRSEVTAAVYSVAPDELATDIGLALEQLDWRLEKKFPHDASIVFFITDGRNDPDEHSPYFGVDIYAQDAFKAFETVRRGQFKVMLLSIGSQTAAKDLSGPLGGEYIEVSSDLTAEGLNNLISDFIGDVEMIAPSNIGNIAGKNVDLKLAFLSSYISDKEISVRGLYFTIDGGDKTEIPAFSEPFTVEANQQVIRTCRIHLPAGLVKGRHMLRIELVSDNLSISGSIQDIAFKYAPFPWLLAAGIAVIVLLLAAGIFIFIRRNFY